MPKHYANRSTDQLLLELRHDLKILRARQVELSQFFDAAAARRLKPLYESIDRALGELLNRPTEAHAFLLAASRLRAAQREVLARKNDVREVQQQPGSAYQRALATLATCEATIDNLLAQ